jgi:hypothetical protein
VTTGWLEVQEEYIEWLQLLQSVRFTLLDKKFVKQQLAKNFPLFSDTKPRPPSPTPGPATTASTWSQLRNIADFINKGEKSLKLGFNRTGRKVKKLNSLSSMSSMVGTAAGNYSRPITTGSIMFQYKQLVVVVGYTRTK